MKTQKVIPFPRVKAKLATVPAALPATPAPVIDDVQALLDALLETHRMGQLTGAVLSLRTDHTERLYLVGEYATNLPAAISAVETSMLTIQARHQLARLAEIGLLPHTPFGGVPRRPLNPK